MCTDTHPPRWRPTPLQPTSLQCFSSTAYRLQQLPGPSCAPLLISPSNMILDDVEAEAPDSLVAKRQLVRQCFTAVLSKNCSARQSLASHVRERLSVTRLGSDLLSAPWRRGVRMRPTGDLATRRRRADRLGACTRRSEPCTLPPFAPYSSSIALPNTYLRTINSIRSLASASADLFARARANPRPYPPSGQPDQLARRVVVARSRALPPPVPPTSLGSTGMAAAIRPWIKDRLTRYEAKNKIDLPLSPGCEVQVEKVRLVAHPASAALPPEADARALRSVRCSG
jgi:hypothetical protein